MKQVFLFTLLICSQVIIQAQPFYKLEGGKLLLSHPIEFKKGTAELMPASDAALNEIKEFLTAKKYITTLRIESHVTRESTVGNPDDFTKTRSLAITSWLVKNGVDCKRLLPVAFGTGKPLTAEDSEANTRIELIPAALNGRPIGGLPLDGGGLVAGNICNE